MAKDTRASEDAQKADRILRACKDRDLHLLRQLASSEGGLVSDDIRRVAWPILLGSDRDLGTDDIDVKDLPAHHDEDQVQLDVNRSFVYYPEGDSETTTDARKAELSQVIVAVLRRHPILHYFQGYHDIVQVLLLVLGIDAAINAVARLSLLRIRDFMLPTISGTEAHLQLLPSILYVADRTLYNHLSQTQPFFALAATLTLYAHDIEEYGDIARLFDFLLASEAAIPVYLFVTVVLSRKEELLEIEAEEPEMLHAILSKLPKPLDLEGLIRRTIELRGSYPPQDLPGRVWSSISSSSVLKTTQDPEALIAQTLQDGERFFQKEAAEIRRRDALKAKSKQLQALVVRYKRPALLTGGAVLVAVLGVLMRRTDTSLSTQLWKSLLALEQQAFEIWQRYFYR